MSTKNPAPAPSGNFETTAQTMMEALDRAGEQLSRNIEKCAEELAGYNLSLQQSFSHQLQQIKEQFQSFFEHNSKELEHHRQKLIDQLELFEQEQIETVVSAGYAVRESLTNYAEQALETIKVQVEEALSKLNTGLDDAQTQITEEIERTVPGLKEAARNGNARCEGLIGTGENELSSQSQDLQRQLQVMVSQWKDAIVSRVDRAQANFAGQTKAAVDELKTMAENAHGQLAVEMNSGSTAIDESVGAGCAEADQLLEQWGKAFENLQQTFQSTLEGHRSESDSKLDADIDHKVAKSNETTQNSGGEVSQKLQTTFNQFERSLETMQHDYVRQIDQLFWNFEIAMDEVARRSGSSQALHRAAADFEEQLNSNLAARSAELIKSVNKLADQMETEYLKSTAGLAEKVENIKSNAVDALEKRVQTTKSESEKVAKSFKLELKELEDHLTQIDEAGKAAAVTVLAYRSALLSLGGD